MPFCLFLSAYAPDGSRRIDGAGLAVHCGTLSGAIPGLNTIVVHVPVLLDPVDPFLAPDDPPGCVLQLYFEALADLEAATSGASPLLSLFDPAYLPMLSGCDWTQQVMVVRTFPVAAGQAQYGKCVSVAQETCTYLVGYEGPADDLSAWLAHYLDSHAPSLTRLPGVRAVEVYTRIDSPSGLPVKRVNDMQRNKVVFDSVEALANSLTSSIRRELRADFSLFPQFRGAAPHYPMLSHTVHLPDACQPVQE